MAGLRGWSAKQRPDGAIVSNRVSGKHQERGGPAHAGSEAPGEDSVEQLFERVGLGPHKRAIMEELGIYSISDLQFLSQKNIKDSSLRPVARNRLTSIIFNNGYFDPYAKEEPAPSWAPHLLALTDEYIEEDWEQDQGWMPFKDAGTPYRKSPSRPKVTAGAASASVNWMEPDPATGKHGDTTHEQYALRHALQPSKGEAWTEQEIVRWNLYNQDEAGDHDQEWHAYDSVEEEAGEELEPYNDQGQVLLDHRRTHRKEPKGKGKSGHTSKCAKHGVFRSWSSLIEGPDGTSTCAPGKECRKPKDKWAPKVNSAKADPPPSEGSTGST
jgi:hypothetical protein